MSAATFLKVYCTSVWSVVVTHKILGHFSERKILAAFSVNKIMNEIHASLSLSIRLQMVRLRIFSLCALHYF